jgi:hypothetical protein
VADEGARAIVATWRLEGAVNLPFKPRIPPYVVTTTLGVDGDGLICSQVGRAWGDAGGFRPGPQQVPPQAAVGGCRRVGTHINRPRPHPLSPPSCRQVDEFSAPGWQLLAGALLGAWAGPKPSPPVEQLRAEAAAAGRPGVVDPSKLG